MGVQYNDMLQFMFFQLPVSSTTGSKYFSLCVLVRQLHNLAIVTQKQLQTVDK